MVVLEDFGTVCNRKDLEWNVIPLIDSQSDIYTGCLQTALTFQN